MNLEELKRLAKAATPGPWKLNDYSTTYYGWSLNKASVKGGDIIKDGDIRLFFSNSTAEDQRHNLDYITAASPDVILELIERLKESEMHLIHSRGKIASEYCSHDGGCGDRDDCYVQFVYQYFKKWGER